MKKYLVFFLIIVSSNLYGQGTSRGGDSESNSESKSGVTHAILIGISDYKNLPASHQLNFADDDALLFKDYLKTQGNVIIKDFLNAKATGKDVIGREIQNVLLNEAKAGDHVLIYFAGHGDIDTLVNEGYLLLSNVDPPVISSYEFSDAFALGTLKKLINAAADRRQIEVTMIADACHSGAVKNGVANNGFQNINSKVTTITSCKATEVSEEAPKWGGGHGVFTHYLIQGLIGLADTYEPLGNSDGIVDLSELQMYVMTNVARDREKQQSPIFDNNNQLSFQVNQKLFDLAQKNSILKSSDFETLSAKKAGSSSAKAYSEPCKSNLQLFYQQAVNGKFFTEDLDSLDRLTFGFDLASTKRLHSKKINAIATSSDGLLTATSSEQGLAITTGMDVERVIWLKELSVPIKSISFLSGKYHLLIVKTDNSVEVWDVVKKTKIGFMTKSPGDITSSIYYQKDIVILGTAKGSLILWNPITGTSKEYKMHKGSMRSLSIVNNSIVSAGEDKMLLSFDLATLKKSDFVQFTLETVPTSLQYSSTLNQLFAGTSDGKISCWDLSSKKFLFNQLTDAGEITGIDVDPAGNFCFYSGLKQKKTGLINLSNLKLEKSKLYTTGSATGVDYDPVYGVLKTIEYDGSYTVQKVRILPQDASAVALHRTVSACGDFDDLQYKIDGTLIVGLNTLVNQVLDQLVNGKEVVSGADLSKAIKHAQTAYDLGKEDEFQADKLRINLLMLQVYSVIQNEQQQAYSQALEQLKEVEKLDPNKAYVYNAVAKLQLLLNNKLAASEAAKKAEKLAPNWTETIVNTGKVLQATGDAKGAELRFKNAIEKAPSQSKSYLALGALYSQQGKNKEALVQLEKAFERSPNSKEIVQLYRETYQKLPADQQPKNKFDQYLSSGKNLIENQVLFRSFTNELRFLDPEIAKKCQITAENATVKMINGELVCIPSFNAKLVTVKVYDFLSDELIASYTLNVKPLPTLEFLWGKSKDGGFVDLKTSAFYLGFPTEPELADCGIQLLGYEAVFIDENSSLGADFNPTSGGGMLAFQGEGATIRPEIFSEIKTRQANEVVGKLCIQYLVQYPNGNTEVKSACFSY